MMGIESVAIRISVAWWVKHYIHAVALMCWITGAEPSMAHVGYWVRKGIKLHIPGHRPPRPIPQPRSCDGME